MSAIHHFIINQKTRALSEGLRIVRDILKSNPFPNGFTSHQLFQIAVQQPPPSDFPAYYHPFPSKKNPDSKSHKSHVTKAPSHPEHPIRSVRFLKLEVLPVLAQSSEIKMVRQRCLTPVNVRKGRDPGFEFVWKVVDPKEGKYWTRRDRGPKEKENIGMDTSNVVHRPHN